MAQFTFETIDGPGTVEGKVCLTLNKNSNPYIAYAGINRQLMLANKVAGSWIREEVFSAGLVSGIDDRICLEIDSEGNPHIAYLNNDSLLTYGVKRDNHWEFTPIPTSRFGDPRGVSGYDFRLHSGRDTPYFAFHDLTTRSLGFTRKVAGQFKRMLVVPESNLWSIGQSPSMVFDGVSETCLIAYINELDEGRPEPLTSVQVTRINDPTEGIVGFTSLLDSGNFRVRRPTSITGGTEWCVAYADLTNGKLKASVFDISMPAVHKEVVTDTVFPVVPSIAKEPGSRHGYRIAFGDENKLKLASRNRFGVWFVEVIDPDGGDMPSLAYDNLGNAHIAYTVGKTLKYAMGKGVRII
ncbi:hypothetical protein BLGI_4995 [Brevibacillus laterosporus GI-9]|uniref:hypothetical protein n=1 Tax=Brevibacillus laterosporus TaxID=1465 RepID=UPI00024052D1|nr:hypothetical protein [Brevibacillus laterosporus]CCF17014.1 hypothetical protein BLGI_4995 [Brevibacillus laterosporus GI-9]